jgi:drug/metabolite transporter (DMT)-like permease
MDLSRGAVIFSVASAAGAVLIGVTLYGETLTAMQQLGVALGLVSLALIFA